MTTSARRAIRVSARVLVPALLALGLLAQPNLVATSPAEARAGTSGLSGAVSSADQVRAVSARRSSLASRKKSSAQCTKRAALTFDDGPNPGVTERFVAVLKRYNVPATFFMEGDHVALAPATARFVANSGFIVGGHGFVHEDHKLYPDAQLRNSISATFNLLRNSGVTTSKIFRFPFGSRTPAQERILNSMGYRHAGWNAAGHDPGAKTSSEILANVMHDLSVFQSRPTAAVTILLHDGQDSSELTLVALPKIIEGIRQKGFCLVPIDEAGQPNWPNPTLSVSGSRCTSARNTLVTLRLSSPAGRAVRARFESTARGKKRVRWVKVGVGRTEDTFTLSKQGSSYVKARLFNALGARVASARRLNVCR